MLVDNASCEPFKEELQKNFSLIAPAGTGKTTAIVKRVLYFLEHSRIPADQLVVLTYTEKAAEELRSRVYKKVISKPKLLENFSVVFFGTIHRFCTQIISKFGEHLGYAAHFKVLQTHSKVYEDLWLSFLEDEKELFPILTRQNKDFLLCYSDFEKILQEAKSYAIKAEPILAQLPHKPDLKIAKQAFENFSAKLESYEKIPKSLARNKERADEWIQFLEDDIAFSPLPEWEEVKGKSSEETQQKLEDSASLWKDLFEPFANWMQAAIQQAVLHIADAFRAYRIQKTYLTFDDQVSLALKIIRQVATRDFFQPYSIILDEAQDTDTYQFALLWLAAGGMLQEDSDAPEASPSPGRFSMVGDPQQLIYPERTNLAIYENYHKALIKGNQGEELTFNVTRRCPKVLVDLLNKNFSPILTGECSQTGQQQAKYVPLEAHLDAEDGSVEVFNLKSGESKPSSKVYTQREKIAVQLARKIKDLGLKGLGITYWSDVALLCPRKKQLALLQESLEKEGLSTQNHSVHSQEGENPAYAWMTALSMVMTDPCNAFELTGILREVYGISDQCIAEYTHTYYKKETPYLHPISLINFPEADNKITQALKQLNEVHRKLYGLPVSEAVRIIYKALDFKARLESLNNGAHFHNILDRLYLYAVEIEMKGGSLEDYAQHLLDNFQLEPKTTLEPNKDKIQLITYQKAKGLEWKVVCLPYLFDPLQDRSPSYPRSFTDEKGMIHFFLDKFWWNLGKVQAFQEKKDHGSQRQLYVACTRSCQKLIFVNDAEFFKKSSSPNEHPMAHFLKLKALKHPQDPSLCWNETYLQSFSPSEEFPKKIDEPSLDLPLSFEALPSANWEFPIRIVPSKLVEDLVPVKDESLMEDTFEEGFLSSKGSLAIQYGNWWHSSMKKAPWGELSTIWETYLERQLSVCPDMQRGQDEFETFFQDALFEKLNTKEVSLRVEVPFFYVFRSAKRPVSFDGYIDLLAFHSSKKYWILVDWKTDKAFKKDNYWIQCYGLQMIAYVLATQAFVQEHSVVEPYLYLTHEHKSLYLDANVQKQLSSKLVLKVDSLIESKI